MKVVDNYLPREQFERITDHILDHKFYWYYWNTVSNDDDPDEVWNSKFLHKAFDSIQLTDAVNVLGDFINSVGCKALKRIIINSYPWTPKVMEHPPHKDYDFKHKGALLNLTTCDGYTYVEGEKVMSVANRVIFFDPSKSHYGTTTSNNKRRVIINMNYF